MQVGLNALSQGTRTVFSSFPLDTEMFCFVTVLESTASPSKQLFQTGHSLPQFRSCRWDLLCCRKRAGASWGPSRPLLSPQKVLKVLLAKMTRCQVRSPLQRGDRGWPVATRIPQTPVPHLAVCVMQSFLLLLPTHMEIIYAQYPQNKALHPTEALQMFS